MKLGLGLVFVISVLLAVTVLGASHSNSNVVGNSEFTRVLERLDAQEGRVEELEKSGGELKEHVKSLKKEVEELKEDIREVRDTSPLKGTPRKNGDKRSIDPRSLRNCRDVMESSPSSVPRAKKQSIYPDENRNSTSLDVVCDFDVENDGGGWTLIQKRSSGPRQQFNQNWTEYVTGFGSLDGNFWLGLENIRALTKKGDQELRIELEDFEGNKAYARYSSFSISDDSDFYRLSISGYSEDSTAADSMTNFNLGSNNNGMRFTTKDKDNDKHSYGNCAMEYGGVGGWWFNDCGYSLLNGLYFEKGETTEGWKGIYWHSWKGWSYSLAKSEMKIRKRK